MKPTWDWQARSGMVILAIRVTLFLLVVYGVIA